MDNLSFVVKNLLDNDSIPSGIYNVADEEPLSSNLLIGLIAKSQGRKIKILHIPVFLIKVVAMLGDGLGLVLNSERLDKLTENYVVSSTKIRNAMGVPFPLTAKQGILKTCESFKTKK
jgi:nucleoside-diphosphate-sugar epimerase